MVPLYTHKKAPISVFFSATIVIFFGALSAADSIGFVPYYIDGTQPSRVALSDLPTLGQTAVPALPASSALPARILIPAIGLNLPVQNPQTRDLSTLDEFLQQGPARYVDSAALGTDGNVLIFAHSSHLPIVHNQMFRAFNRISELALGDEITVEGGNGAQYRYRVASVRKADAASASVDLSRVGHKLTLVTCDTLTGKGARFVVEAELI